MCLIVVPLFNILQLFKLYFAGRFLLTHNYRSLLDEIVITVHFAHLHWYVEF